MRISDWSSDVCSSDLFADLVRQRLAGDRDIALGFGDCINIGHRRVVVYVGDHLIAGPALGMQAGIHHQPARAPQFTLQPSEVHRSDEHTSELQSLMRISYAVFCLQKKNNKHLYTPTIYTPYN